MPEEQELESGVAAGVNHTEHIPQPCPLLDLPTELLLQIIEYLIEGEPGLATDARICVTSVALRWTCLRIRALCPDPTVRKDRVSRQLVRDSGWRHTADTWLDELVPMEEWPEYTITPPVLIAPEDHKDSHSSRVDGERNAQAPRETWQSHLTPLSRHACRRCLMLKKSSGFALPQLTGQRGKGEAQSRQRFCIICGVREQLYTPTTPMLRIVEDWEGPGMLATGVVCQRCKRFVVAGRDSVAALRRKCDECRSYRPR